jgi:hypothetical protein
MACGNCGRVMGKTRTHLILDGPVIPERIVCIRCIANARAAHTEFYPDCSVGWHDVYDHPMSFATRAAAANMLGLWP